MSEPDVVVNVDYVVDQRGIAAAEQSVKEGADKATSAARHLVANIEKAGSSTGRLATNVSKVQRDLTRAGREALSFQQAMDGVGAAVSSIDQGLRNLQSEITKSKTLQRQAIIDQRLTADRARQADIESARAANSRLNIETQKAAQSQLISQRQAGQQRIQLTRAVIENIGRLEKGLGAVIAGAARTATGAAGRVFDTFTAKVRNSNRAFTDGTSTSLSRREQILRSSFAQQEAILSRSAVRQRQLIAGINTQARTGVTGVIGRSGLGAAVGAAGLFAGLKSTFTIGADFAQGLSVLGAQLDLTAEQIDLVRQRSIELGNDIALPGVSALDSAQAIQLLSKQFAALGSTAVDAASLAAQGTLQLSIATGATAEEAAAVVGASVNVFGIAADQATAVADQVAAAIANSAGVSFSDFADSFRQGAAVFAQFQKPAVGASEALTEFNTALAVIARSGVVGSDAGTSLKQFFLQANRGTDDANAALGAIVERAGEVGGAFFDAAGDARPFAETLDILRRGLVGYSDEQRSSALQTIFGSDAIRVANALLSVTTEEYEAVTTAVRQQGLAAKLAAAQNTGLRGAIDALRSVFETIQIVLFEKVNKGLGDFVLGIAGAVNAVAFGEGAFETLRSALIGVAAGLGAVIAAKGALEVLNLLGAAAKLAFTPFGALLVVAGLVGGAFNLLYRNSEEFRIAIADLGLRLGNVAVKARAFVAPAFAAIGDLISRVVIPAVIKAAEFVTRNLVPAFDAASSFITGTVVPALRRFGEFLRDNVLPVLAEFGALVRVGFNQARAAVSGFVDVALPKLEEVGRKAQEIGQGIVESLGGRRLLLAASAGLVGFAAGGPLGAIVATFASLADKIIPALKPVGERILAFFKGIFTKANLVEVGKGALQIVETIGFAIGTIVTNPKFVTALAAVAAAAALVAIRFIEGFGRAFIQNIPGLVSLVGKGFSELIKVAFDPQIIAVALAAAFVLPRLLRGFRTLGQEGAGAFTSGFTSRMRSARGFTNGLLSGIGGLGGGGAKASASVFKSAFAELDDLQRKLRAFGSNSQVKLSPAGFAAARAEIGKITNGIDEATLRGILFRDTVSRGFTTVAARGSQVAGGFRQIGTAFSQAVQNAGVRVAAALAEFASAGTRQAPLFKRNGTVAGDQFAVSFRDRVKFGVGQIATGFKSGFAELGQIAKSQGAHLGAVLGSAISVGVAGFLGGKMEGAAGGSGLVSVISATLTGAAIGGAPAAAVGFGAALIGTALGKAQKAAEDAEAAARTLADALKNDLADGLKAGKDGALDLKEALDDASDSALGTALKEQLLGFLPELVKLGVTQQDIIAAFREGGDAFDDLIAKVGGKQISSKSNGGFFDVDFNPFNDPNTTAIYENQAAVDAVTAAYVALKDAIELTNAETKFAGVNAPKLFSAVGLSVEEASGKFGPFVDGYRGLRDIVETEATPRFTESMGRALEDAKIKADAVSAAIDSIFGNRDPQGLAASFDAAIVSVAGQFTDLKVGGGLIDQATLDIALEDLKGQLSGVAKAGINEGVIFDEATLTAQTLGVLGAALDGVEDPALRAAITAAYEDGVANAVPLLNTVNIYDQIAAGLTEPISVKAELDASSLNGTADTLARQGGAAGERAGRLTADGFERGLRARAQKAADAAAAVARSVAAAFDNVFEFGSPSRVTTEMGRFISQGLALGIREGSAVASEAANQLAFATIGGLEGFKSSGYTFGKDIGQAIVDGLADTEADMASVVSSAVSSALEGLASLGDPLRNATSSAASQLFGGVTGSDRSVPGGKGGDVAGTQANITQGLQGFLSTFDSNVSQIFEVNAKKLKDLSATEREIFGTDVFSLDVSTVFGASNVTALTSSLDSIAAFGEAIIAQGVPLDQVSAKLQMYIDDLVTTATNLGFNQDQLLDLVATLGLSDAAIDDFINKVNDLTTTAASATPTPKPEDATYFRPVQNFIIQLPTGDPRAAALAVANSQAAAAELP